MLPTVQILCSRLRILVLPQLRVVVRALIALPSHRLPARLQAPSRPWPPMCMCAAFVRGSGSHEVTSRNVLLC